jgi:hypothetical protein
MWSLPNVRRLALIGLFFIAAPAAWAQEPVSYTVDISPKLVRNDRNAIRPALRLAYSVEHRAHQATVSFSRSLFFESTGRATFVTEPEQNPDNQELRLALGAEMSLRKVAEIDFDADPDADEGPFEFDYGVVGIDLAGAYEVSQDWDEQAFRLGVEGRYTTEIPWLPSALVAFHALFPARSDVRDTLGEDEDTFWRLDGGLYWFIPIGPIALALEAAGFRALGLSESLERAGFEDGLYGSAALVYRPFHALGPLRLDEVFIRWTEGQRPTATEARHAGAIGLTLGVE